MKLVDRKGTVLFLVLVATSIFLMLLSSAIALGLTQQKWNKMKVAHSQALHVAEAGVSYYRWVLYHDKTEYCNKEQCKTAPNYGPYGPYEYSDQSGSVIGYYELYITPPQNNSTIVKIKSVGWMKDYPNIKRTIEVQCGIPSWSSYATLSNSSIRFGEGTETWGQIHSNGGIRFDGLAHNVISSSLLNYDDPDHEGSNEFGVHTHLGAVDPLPDSYNPPRNVPARSDVFMSGRSFPVPIVSFDLLNDYVSDTLGIASSSGLVLNASNAKGYHIKFNSNNTMDIKIVNNITAPCSRCVETGCTRYLWSMCISYGCTSYESSDTYGISSESNYRQSVHIPSSGVIFVKDNVWVEGRINNARVTLLAFKEPITGNTSDIIINNDLLYTNKDGRDAIGLIAQRNITIGFYSENDLEVDASMIAKGGRVGRDYFDSTCGSQYYRSNITIYGSIATNERYGFSYTDGSGYDNRSLLFDGNLKFSPPPHFPTTGEYSFVSWEEK